MFGQLVLAGKLHIIRFEFVDLLSVNLLLESQTLHLDFFDLISAPM